MFLKKNMAMKVSELGDKHLISTIHMLKDAQDGTSGDNTNNDHEDEKASVTATSDKQDVVVEEEDDTFETMATTTTIDIDNNKLPSPLLMREEDSRGLSLEGIDVKSLDNGEVHLSSNSKW